MAVVNFYAAFVAHVLFAVAMVLVFLGLVRLECDKVAGKFDSCQIKIKG